MPNPNDNLSRCASALLRVERELESYYNDEISIECGFECADIIVGIADDKRMDILRYWGYESGDEFMVDFKRRTSMKCARDFCFLIH